MCPATTIASTNFVNVYCLLSRLLVLVLHLHFILRGYCLQVSACTQNWPKKTFILSIFAVL